jgi:hypothetical protein
MDRGGFARRILFDKEVEDTDYWNSNCFWPEFLQSNLFDHYHFIEVFKVVVGDPECRRVIVNYLLNRFLFIYSDCRSCQEDDQFANVKKNWTKAVENNVEAILTYKYPPFSDSDGSLNSHFIILWGEPASRCVLCIDSRGIDYAVNYCKKWKLAKQKLQQIFHDCKWFEYCYFDMQSEQEDDHFCQTWSLILLEEAYLQRGQRRGHETNTSLSEYYQSISTGTTNYWRIVDFWRRCLSDLPTIKERLYNQIYSMTHHLGKDDREHRCYHGYFSTLEALVCGSDDKFYDQYLSYEDSNFTFLEDFLDCLLCRGPVSLMIWPASTVSAPSITTFSTSTSASTSASSSLSDSTGNSSLNYCLLEFIIRSSKENGIVTEMEVIDLI